MRNTSEKHYRKDFLENGDPVTLIVRIAFDDRFRNGHKTFSITADHFGRYRHQGEPTIKHAAGHTLWLNACGCLHDAVRERFPELAPYLRWHLVSTDGPLHYVANALYWRGLAGWCNGGPTDPPNERHFRSVVVWGAVPDLDNGREVERMDASALKAWLAHRLPPLLAAFKHDVEQLGFTY